MKITLLVIGKTVEAYLKAGISNYCERLKHYTKFEIIEIPNIKNSGKLSSNQIIQKEAESLLKHLEKYDYSILLDEKGKSLSSVEFADFIQKRANESKKSIVFVVGGAYGFSNEIKEKADFKLSLSAMTFSHQMVRLFFAEQLYRAFTVIMNEKYHNE